VNYYSNVATYIVYILPAVLNKLPSKVYMAAVSVLQKCQSSIVFVGLIKWPAFIDICVYSIGDSGN